MFASLGGGIGNSCMTFVSQAAYEAGIKEELDLKRIVLPVRNCRNIGKKDMQLNSETPNIKVDPETYKVTIDGELITSDPVDKVALGQLYNLF